jgi:hypothetical protein
MTATRQGSVRVQAAHSTARCWRHLAWAEPPGRPTVARTRTAATGRSAWPVIVVEGPGSRADNVHTALDLEEGLEDLGRLLQQGPEGQPPR